MNFSCLYFYPRHPRHNLGRQACFSHFKEFQIGQSPIFRGCQIFVSFLLGKLCKLSDICSVCVGGGGGGDPVRAILEIIQFFLFKQ